MPENWTAYTFGSPDLTILAGDSALIPLRIYIPVKVTGGLHYMVSAAFRTSREAFHTSAYYFIAKNSSWEVDIQESNIFYNIYNDRVDLSIRLQNRGNVNEIIRLDFDIGGLYILDDHDSKEQVRYINLSPATDTVLKFPVRYNRDLKPADESRMVNNWKQSTIGIKASTFEKERNLQVRLNKLDSEFQNTRVQRSSPLNLELQVYNLLSAAPPRFNMRTFGNILLKNERDLDYHFALNNLYFRNAERAEFNLYRQLNFDVNYQDPSLSIRARHNSYGGQIHYISGWGMSSSYKVNQENTARLAIAQHPIALNRGAFGGWDTRLGPVGLKTGITYEDHPSGRYRGVYLLTGVQFQLKKKHNVGLDLVGSGVRYRNAQLVSAEDTSVLGISYRLSYKYRSEKFRFSIQNLNTIPSSTRNSGRLRLDLNSKYIVKPNFRFDLYYSANYYKLVRYPYSFYYPSNFDMYDYGQLYAVISSRSVVYQVGPVFNSNTRNFHDRNSGYTTIYRSYYPGLGGALTFRINEEKRISPNASVYNLVFRGSSEDPQVIPNNYNAMHY